MSVTKKKMIFIPADCISAKMSRSYFLGKDLSILFDLTWLNWKDSRNLEWTKENKSFWYTRLYIFIQNIFKKSKLIKRYEYNIYEIPFFSQSFIRYIFGEIISLKIARFFNNRTLIKVTNQIKPDIIFYADGFHFFPVINNKKVIIFSDLQDDFDFQQMSKCLKQYTVDYLNKCYKYSSRNYVVTNFAAKNLQKHLNVKFSFLPNGAELNKIKKISNSQILEYKSKLNIENKIVVTYIGGDVWFDKIFMNELSIKSMDYLPNVVFILIGDLPRIFRKNVINLGYVTSEETYIYYNLSDIGILPKDSKGDLFLLNSMPLKIIQYSCIGKPVLCTNINWVIENKFSNVFVTDFIVDSWVKKIDRLSFQNIQDSKWDNYDWTSLSNTIYKDFNSISSV